MDDRFTCPACAGTDVGGDPPRATGAVMETILKVKFEGERQRYTVQARNARFAIMTKPFNAKQTYLYTITDLQRGVRGPCNLIFGLPCDVDTPEGAAHALALIEAGVMEVSYRRCKALLPSEIVELEALSAAVSL